jgi:hypothetical protein
MTRQLRTRDLRPGDILLKSSDGSVLSRLIQFGQSVTGGENASIVHAGVVFEQPYIIEAQGSGITANDLRVQNGKYGYHVVRCRNPNMAAGAGTCAKMMFDIHKRGGNLGYSVPGAVGSLMGPPGAATSRDQMDVLFDRILEGKSHRLFCSQFVVYVYQFVAEQNGVAAESVFNSADAKVEPSALASMLARNVLFGEEGYLMPGER